MPGGGEVGGKAAVHVAGKGWRGLEGACRSTACSGVEHGWDPRQDVAHECD